MERCSAESQTNCIIDHILPRLEGRRRREGNGWVADCPACRKPDKLSIEVADTRRQWILLHCHAGRGGNGCDDAKIRTAMVGRPYRISERCLPPASSGSPPRDSSQELARLTAFLDELISQPRAGNELRIRICQRLNNVDALEAAYRLKIPERTAYRYRDTK